MAFTTIDDIRQVEKVPMSERSLPKSTYHAIRQCRDQKPDRPALIFLPDGENFTQNITYTYDQLFGCITQVANLFDSLGVSGDSVVSMLLPNLPQAHFTIWGAEAVGIVNPINPMLEGHTIGEIMTKAGSKVLVTLAPSEQNYIWPKIASVVAEMECLETIIFVGDPSQVPSIDGKKCLNWQEAVSEHSTTHTFAGRDMTGDEVASMFHTGGTTGTPKLAQHTHSNIVTDAWMCGLGCGEVADTVFFCGLPLFHVNAVLATGIMPFSLGGTVVLGPPAGYRSPGIIQNFWKIVEEYKINFFSGVPTIYGMLLSIPIGDADISSLQYGICGAAPMAVELFRSFEETTNVSILEGYGLTEGTCVSTLNPMNGDRRIGSIGLPLPYQKIKVVQLDDEGNVSKVCGPNEIGTLVMQGPNVFAGYNDDIYNKKVWVSIPDTDGQWLNTGDLGRYDTEGYYWLTGRQKELIIRGGHNIDPKTIEEVLHRHPAVAVAAAVGKPDPSVGELPVAYVELKPDMLTTPDMLLEFASMHIGERAAIPKEINIIETMPLTAVGKIFKPTLAELELTKVIRSKLDSTAGVDLDNLSVRRDKVLGRVALIPISSADEAVEKAIHDALSAYTFKYEIVK